MGIRTSQYCVQECVVFHKKRNPVLRDGIEGGMSFNRVVLLPPVRDVYVNSQWKDRIFLSVYAKTHSISKGHAYMAQTVLVMC